LLGGIVDLSVEVKVRVAEAKTRDVGRKIIRLERSVMKKLNVGPGDFVEIIGPKGSSVCQVWPIYVSDEGKGFARIDGIVRESIGVGIGDIVSMKKVDVQPASRIILAPTTPIRFGPDFVEYVKNTLMGKPVSRGETIIVPAFTTELRFIVVSSQPTQHVYVTLDTEVEVKEEPVKEAALTRGVPRVTWEDIGDLEEAKQKIREIVELPLRHPEIFTHLGIEPPKGILLYGPPGVGKTLLAKALANEVGAYFVSINGPEVMSKFYGESEKRVREIFEDAEKNAPSIIFIDEIDAIAPKREEVTGEVERRVVAQLLALMDGLKGRGKVIVIGATNRPQALDPALRRPGRFDREIEIRPPDKNGRKEILQVHTRNMPLADDVDLEEFAKITHGYTGADLAALAREAAMTALRRFLPEIDLSQPSIPVNVLQKLKVTRSDFLEAMKFIQPTLLREIYIEVPEVHWSDIGGLNDVKQVLREAVEWPLKYPEIFKGMGIVPPRGILLYGPPGTGKTLLAKAVATESEANFISVRGPELLSKWVGESEKAVREVFRRARQAAPCIVFFDEIDSIAPARGYRMDSSGVTDRIVNQLLAEMDGIIPLQNVVVIAATNRPDIVDPALLRPGRFDRIVYVPPPDKEARKEIFKIHLRNTPLADDVDLDLLSEKTEGYTGADISALCREAVLAALREKFEVQPLSMKYFEAALKIVPPSLKLEDVERYERMGRELRRAIT